MRWVMLLKPKLMPQREGGGNKWHLTVTRNQSLVNLVRSNIRIVSTCMSEVSWAFLILVELQTNLPLFHKEIKKWKVLLESCTGQKRKTPLWCYNPTSCYLWHWEGFKIPTLLTGGPKLKGHSQTWTVFWRSSPFSTDRLHQAFGVQIEERGHETPGKEGKLESSTLATKP